MLYYILPTIAFLLYIFIELPKQDENKKYPALWIFALFIISIGGFRYEIGTDWLNYSYLFEELSYDMEPLFLFFSYIVLAVGGSFHLFVFIIFVIAFLLKIWSFEKLSKSIAISLVIYFGFWFMVYDINQIRQGFALGLIGVALYFTYKDNFKGFLIVVLLAATMHYPAIIFLPFYFFRNIVIKKKYMILIVFVLFIFALFGVTNTLISYIVNISGFDVLDVLSHKVKTYNENSHYNQNILFSFSTFHRLFIFAITLIAINKIPADNKLKNIFLMSAFANLSIYLLFSGNEIIAGRLSVYFRFSECFFFTYLPYCFQKTNTRYFACLLLYVYVLMQLYIVFQNPESIENLLPYKNYLFHIL